MGLLGTNGTGKSTALSILLGRIKPNLGQIDGNAPDWQEIIKYYRGSTLQNYLTYMLENKLRVVIKPQLEARFAKRLSGRKVRDMIEQRDERKIMDRIVKELELEHVLDREIQQLSGGELQRFAVAVTLCREADVYMFDEVTSFLDVRQRLTVTDKIRDLVHSGNEWPGGDLEAAKKYVVSAFLYDYLCCFIYICLQT